MTDAEFLADLRMVAGAARIVSTCDLHGLLERLQSKEGGDRERQFRERLLKEVIGEGKALPSLPVAIAACKGADALRAVALANRILPIHPEVEAKPSGDDEEEKAKAKREDRE